MEERTYHVAAYLRLSRDDEDVDGRIKAESNSIHSQRELICSFIREHEDLELYDIYADDGYSGANFKRPEFGRMMADIEAGKVNCVIVKDLSRFGRDYIEAGRLLQKTFPAFHVRFIAVTDNYDSETADRGTKMLVLPIKNFINDSYCRDISQKVKSYQKTRREQGKFIGAFAVYGYRKSEEDKNKLCPDEDSAGIVRNIFAWKMEGMSTQAIAERLNDFGVPSPLEYKKFLGEKFSTGFRTNLTAKWSAVAVKRILTNELYTGIMIQGKTEKINYKIKKTVEKPKKEWIRVEGTQEEIISREDFETVQRLLQTDTRAQEGSVCGHLFSGLLFCGDCGQPMARRVNRCRDAPRVYFICSARNKGQDCSRHSIPEEELKTVVFRILQTYAAVFLDERGLSEYLQRTQINVRGIGAFEKAAQWLRSEQQKCLELQEGLQEDARTGLITEEEFKNLRTIYEKRYEEAKEALKKQKNMQQQLFQNGVAAGMKLEKLKETMELTQLDRDALLCFVNRIEVYENKRVYVEFRGRQEFF